MKSTFFLKSKQKVNFANYNTYRDAVLLVMCHSSSLPLLSFTLISTSIYNLWCKTEQSNNENNFCYILHDILAPLMIIWVTVVIILFMIIVTLPLLYNKCTVSYYMTLIDKSPYWEHSKIKIKNLTCFIACTLIQFMNKFYMCILSTDAFKFWVLNWVSMEDKDRLNTG